MTVSTIIVTLGLGVLAAVPAVPRARPRLPLSARCRSLVRASGPAVSRPGHGRPAIDPARATSGCGLLGQRLLDLRAGRDIQGVWGSTGSGPGQFDFVTADQHPSPFGTVAFAPDGSFYVADIGNFRVQAFDKDRDFVREWGTSAPTTTSSRAPGRSPRTAPRSMWVTTPARTSRRSTRTGPTCGTFPAGGLPWPNAFFTLDPMGRIVSIGPPANPEATTGWGVTVLDPKTGTQVRCHHPINVPGLLPGHGR